VPSFGISDGARFAGEFRLEPVAGAVPSAAERAYLETLERVADALAADEEDDPSGTDPASRALTQERRRIRSSAAAELRGQADEFVAGVLPPEPAAANALVIKGKYLRDLERLAGSLFVVSEKIDPGTNFANDLLISVAADLPPPNDVPSPEKQALFVAISEALTVILTVCDRMRDTESARADRLLDQYVRKLAGIGRLGLQGPHVALGSLALNGLKGQFVAQEAGRIKNRYIRRLGMATGVAALLSFVAYWLSADVFRGSFLDAHKVFLLAAGGASIGTWLSFSIRRVTLSFNELGVIEEDLLEPSVRVLFVIALTVTVCLLFWTGAMNIEIGNLKTAELGSKSPTVQVGAIALLVGVFCGIAERALATAVSGRAAAFVKGLGGS
jgi:hypothetical protein